MHWTQTISGRKMDLLEPRQEDVSFDDVAHNLGHCNRFAGATRKPYSVAEHCVRVHDELRRQGYPAKVQLVGLLHDAHEAYMGDITTPTKNAITAIAEGVGVAPTDLWFAIDALKRQLDEAIFGAAGLDRADPEVGKILHGPVKLVDAAMMLSERDTLMSKPPEPWGDLEGLQRPPLSRHAGWKPATARHLWLSRLEDHLGRQAVAA